MPGLVNDAVGADVTPPGESRPSKRIRLSAEEHPNYGSLLPAPVWAIVLSYLPFDDMKDCTALNRTFLTEVAPQVNFGSNFTLEITDPVVWSPWIERGRFRGVQKATIRSSVTSMTLRQILLDLGSSLSSLCLNHDLDSEDDFTAGPRSESLLDRVQLELSNAFSPVKSTLLNLSLSTSLYPELIMPAVTSLQGLVRLELVINSRMWFCYSGEMPKYSRGFDLISTADKVSFGQSLQALEALTNLTELKLSVPEDIDDFGTCEPEIVAGFMLGCSRIKNLRVLDSEYLKDWGECCQHAFATMMGGLEELEVLSTVTFPKAHLWQKVMTTGGGIRLKELVLDYSEMEHEEDLKLLVRVILHQFCLLKSVVISLENHRPLPGGLDETLQLLAPLKEHPKLTNIKFYINDCNRPEIDWNSGVTRLQELVGNRIQVEDVWGAAAPC